MRNSIFKFITTIVVIGTVAVNLLMPVTLFAQDENDTIVQNSKVEMEKTSDIEDSEKEDETSDVEDSEKEDETSNIKDSKKEDETPDTEDSKKEDKTSDVDDSEKEAETPDVDDTEKETETSDTDDTEKEAETPDVNDSEKEDTELNKQINLVVDGSKVSFDNDFSVSEDETFNTSDDISKEEIESEVRAYADNQPPVAGLQYLVLNPDSLINGRITTNTQIAWLWSYNGQDFTYDPDGDEIVNRMVDGIPSNSIIGTVTGGIGFVTQFSAPAQYQMTYQVEDSNGALSNVLKVTVAVEPADGTQRPVINVTYTPQKLYVDQLMMVSWAKSYDNDVNDAVMGVSGMIRKDGVNTSINDYVQEVSNDKQYMVLSFKEEGDYEIWVRVYDKRDAYSNWVIIPMNVERAQFSNVNMVGHTESTVPEEEWWVDNYKARALIQSKDLTPSWESVEYLLKNAASHSFPKSLPLKQILQEINLSGDLKDSNGNPIANAEVKIDLPMTTVERNGELIRCGITDYVKTDANGHFSYQLDARQYWEKSYYADGRKIEWQYLGDIAEGNYAYIHYSMNGTIFVYPTTLTLTYSGAEYTEKVTVNTGYTRVPWVGSFYYDYKDRTGWYHRES